MTNDKQRERLVELLMDESCYTHECPDFPCQRCKNLNIYEEDAERIADLILADGWMRLPCKVGDKYYKVERWCTEGGYWDKPKYAYSSTCEDCCEECDGEDNIIEYTFHSPQQILSLERVFGKYVFLTREEAEAKLKEGVRGCF